jgi:cytochrome bd-type quinol oxidase subunit 2
MSGVIETVGLFVVGAVFLIAATRGVVQIALAGFIQLVLASLALATVVVVAAAILALSVQEKRRSTGAATYLDDLLLTVSRPSLASILLVAILFMLSLATTNITTHLDNACVLLVKLGEKKQQ